MKRALCILLVLAMLPSLCACGSIYSNYREMEQLLVLQTMGLDTADGGVRLSLASAADTEKGSSPIRLEVEGVNISSAFDRTQNYSFEESLFFSHIGSLLIGEDAARLGIDDAMNYICQAPRLRMDMPVYIIRGSTAAESIMGTGDEGKGISEILMGVREYLENRSAGTLFTAADIERSSLRYGSALACALELSPSIQDSSSAAGSGEAQGGSGASQKSSGAGSSTVAAAGYAVLKDSRLCAYLSMEQGLGVCFLLNSVGRNDIVVTDSRGSSVTMEINCGSCGITPVWDSSGALSRVDVSASVRASVTEINGKSDLDDAEYADYLTGQLESYVSDRISYVLRISRQLNADFLGLAGTVERSSPSEYAAMDKPFTEIFPTLELRVTVKGQLSHSNDTRQTA